MSPLERSFRVSFLKEISVARDSTVTCSTTPDAHRCMFCHQERSTQNDNTAALYVVVRNTICGHSFVCVKWVTFWLRNHNKVRIRVQSRLNIVGGPGQAGLTGAHLETPKAWKGDGMGTGILFLSQLKGLANVVYKLPGRAKTGN